MRTSAIELEGVRYKRALDRVRNLRLCRALIQISDWRSPRVKALLQSAIKSLLHFLAEIPAVVGRHDRLNVCGEPTGGRFKINAFGSKVNIQSGVHELA